MQIVANQSLPFGQGNRGTRQVGRAQPSPERIVNATKSRIDPTQCAKRSAVGRMCQSVRPGNGHDLGYLACAFLVIGQLADATPLVIELNLLLQQGVILAPGKGEGGAEEVFQRIAPAIQQWVQRPLAIAGCALCGLCIGAIQGHPGPTAQ